jgi:hypothetical protein
VLEAAPDKAKDRREHAAKQTRVERWGEDSGNGALAGRELPPAAMLAADHKITAWARQLKKAGLAGRPGQLAGTPIDPWLARDLARAAATSPRTTWCVTVTDQDGHATWHACARPAPKSHNKRRKRGSPGTTGNRDGPQSAFSFTRTSRDGPPGSPGTWTLTVHGREFLVEFHPLTTDDCDHRFETKGHDPSAKLRHLAQIRHATCTSPVCRRLASQCDYEHNTPYEKGGRTCLCNADPKCRHDHQLKQHPRWKADQLPDGTFRWTTPSGRSYTTEPTRYPI